MAHIPTLGGLSPRRSEVSAVMVVIRTRVQERGSTMRNVSGLDVVDKVACILLKSVTSVFCYFSKPGINTYLLKKL